MMEEEAEAQKHGLAQAEVNQVNQKPKHQNDSQKRNLKLRARIRATSLT